MTTSEPVNRLSPLDQIRNTEADVTRRIAAVRETAAAIVANARARAKAILNEARETGRWEGQKQYKEIISKAEEEAQAVIAQARYRADELRYKGDRIMGAAVDQAVKIILGLDEGGNADES
jgi:vacuolar-type H+-ATPase subunit H